HALAPLFRPPAAGTPVFARGPAWADKCLNAALGAWVEAEHAVQLHTKDARFYSGMGDPFERFRGYAEPAPDLYARLADLTERTRARLRAAGVIEASAATAASPGGGPALSDAHFARLADLLRRLAVIAAKELAGTPLEFAEGRLFDDSGDTLKWLAFNTSNLDVDPEDPAKTVALAAEDQSGRRREVAIGRVFPIYVAVPSEYGLMLCRGGCYSYYEFATAGAAPLTDLEWRRRLDAPGAAPEPWLSGKGLGVEPTPEVAVTVAEVAEIAALVAEVAQQTPRSYERLHRRLRALAARPVPPESLPALLDTVQRPGAPPFLRQCLARWLHGWEDARAREFFVREVAAWQPQARSGDFGGSSSEWNDDELRPNPVYGAVDSERSLLIALAQGLAAQAGTADGELLRSVWRRFAPLGQWMWRPTNKLDGVLDPLGDALARLDRASARRFFEEAMAADELRASAFRQFYRLNPDAALDALAGWAARSRPPALYHAVSLLYGDPYPGGRTRLHRLARTAPLAVRYAALSMLFADRWDRRTLEADDLTFVAAGRAYRPDRWDHYIEDGGPAVADLFPDLLRARRPAGLSRSYAAAIVQAGRAGATAAADEIAAVLQEETAARRYGEVFRACAAALGALGGDAGRAALRAAWSAIAREPADRLVAHKLVVVAALVMQEMPEAEAALPSLLTLPRTEGIDRLRYCGRLAALGTPFAEALVVRLLQDPEVWDSTKDHLAGSIASPVGAETARTCVRRLAAGAGRTRQEVPGCRLAAEQVVPTLLECLDREPEERCAGALRDWAARYDHPLVFERLRAWATDANAERRCQALVGLVEQRSQLTRAVGLLATALEAKDRRESTLASHALLRCGPAGEAALAARLERGSGWPRAAAYLALRSVGASGLPRYLEALLADADPWARGLTALDAVAANLRHPPDRAVEVLAALLADPEQEPALTIARKLVERAERDECAWKYEAEDAARRAQEAGEAAAPPVGAPRTERLERVLEAARKRVVDSTGKAQKR
ncbi:MAG: DUF3160 domain-containing protein, partial [Planctomycetes bacterium]|nr:DUF3160 domain-containing protein [Planctomycetota bacterium]